MKVAVVTGSAGFIGTNLVKLLLTKNYAVIGLDNFSSSESWKSELFKDNENYEFIEFDITKPFIKNVEQTKVFRRYKKVDEIFNLACPASPPRYVNISIETIRVNVDGMFNILNAAKHFKAKVLHSSTSEVYGDPQIHPQPETYRGNVNTVGPRSCYDEGKRISETICYEYKRLYDMPIKLVRIFNTYGPFMDPLDGRVITNFILQALNGEDLTIYGDGKQTRSFQYIDDLLDGFLKVMQTENGFFGPVNLGNPVEFTVKQLAKIILKKIKTKSELKFVEVNENDPYQKKHDPQQRKPAISRAKSILKWEPKIDLDKGLDKTIEYYSNLIKN